MGHIVFLDGLKFISFCFIALKQITKTDKDSLLLAKQLLNHNIQKQGKKKEIKKHSSWNECWEKSQAFVSHRRNQQA